MKTLKRKLVNNYKIRVIEYGEESPMLHHKYGEIAADDTNLEFYVHALLVNMNGPDSIVKACNSYKPPLGAILCASRTTE